MFTPIHRALGLEPQDLNWGHIERAVQEGVREAEDLDWQGPGDQYGLEVSRHPGSHFDGFVVELVAILTHPASSSRTHARLSGIVMRMSSGSRS